MSYEFELNGEKQSFEAEPMERLLDVLRERALLTGTKEGCGEGECGACSVLLDGEVVCSCLVPVFQVDGRKVQTIEGISKKSELSPVQAAFVEECGVQCGACTPGFIVTARALLERHSKPSRRRIREAFGGNLCRCTGYERIFQSVEVAARVKRARKKKKKKETDE